MMKCAAAQELISDYLDGALSPELEAELNAHWESCQDCRELARDFAAIVQGAKGLASHEPSAEVWPKIAAEVRQVRPEAVETRVRWSRLGPFRKPAAWVYATAAALVFVVVAGLIIRQRPWSATASAKERSVEFTLAKLQEAQDYYEKAIQALNEAVKSRKDSLDPRLADMFSRNLAAMDETIQSCRQIIREDPDNLTVRAYLLTAYREKVNFLEEMMGAGRSSVYDKGETTL